MVARAGSSPHAGQTTTRAVVPMAGRSAAAKGSGTLERSQDSAAAVGKAAIYEPPETAIGALRAGAGPARTARVLAWSLPKRPPVHLRPEGRPR